MEDILRFKQNTHKLSKQSICWGSLSAYMLSLILTKFAGTSQKIRKQKTIVVFLGRQAYDQTWLFEEEDDTVL